MLLTAIAIQAGYLLGVIAREGVRANIVIPGPIVTPGGDEVRKTITTAMGMADEDFFKTVPLEGRASQPEDLAEAIVFLVSPRASYCRISKWRPAKSSFLQVGMTCRPRPAAYPAS
jgi:hypothetical protein